MAFDFERGLSPRLGSALGPMRTDVVRHHPGFAGFEDRTRREPIDPRKLLERFVMMPLGSMLAFWQHLNKSSMSPLIHGGRRYDSKAMVGVA